MYFRCNSVNLWPFHNFDYFTCHIHVNKKFKNKKKIIIKEYQRKRNNNKKQRLVSMTIIMEGKMDQNKHKIFPCPSN